MAREAKNIFFIINPIAGASDNRHIASALARHCQACGITPRIMHSCYAGHTLQLAAEAIEEKVDAIVAVGGDGTLNEVARVVYQNHSCVPIGVIPVGSGNGLARHLNISSNIKKTCQIINKFKTAPIDILTVGDRIAVNILGIGYEAEVCKKFGQSFKIRGLMGYLMQAAKMFFSYKPIELDLKVEDSYSVSSCECFSMTFANGSQFGNNVIIAPDARIDDGLINLIMMKKPSLIQALRLVYTLFKKRLSKEAAIFAAQAQHIEVKTNADIMHVDGELVPIKPGTPLTITLKPKALHMIVP